MPHKTGRLELRPAHKRTTEALYFCVDCNTSFPLDSSGIPTCNHWRISKCPWCRPDSKPWRNGRGA